MTSLVSAELREAGISVRHFGAILPLDTLCEVYGEIGDWRLVRIRGCWKAQVKLGCGIPKAVAAQLNARWYGSIRVFGFPGSIDPKYLFFPTVTSYHVEPGEALVTFADFLRQL